jgi:gliding motility-associated-like protein
LVFNLKVIVKNILYMKQLYIVFLFFLLIKTLSAQTPFVCDGAFYLSLGTGGTNTTFYEVTVDNVTGNVLFNSLAAANSGASINGIGYRITDNFIYGVTSSSGGLYRIDATGQSFFIQNLNTPTGYSMIAGDVTPDGNTLILLGSTGNPAVDQAIFEVDLTSPTYNVTTVNLTSQSTGGLLTSRSADIAIDPITGTIYGFTSGKLITYDRNTGVVDDVTFPNSSIITGTVGAMFFDTFGNLKAYGRATTSTTQEDFFEINKNTGIATAITKGPQASQNDGCSCPYTIQIEKTANIDTVKQCEKVIFNFKIANQSGIDRPNIDFQDVMPPQFTVSQVISNPLGGTVTGIGTNTLNINGMLVPIGTNIIQVEATASSTALGTFYNQAVLFGLPPALGGTAVSDYPATILENDPTPITIIPHDFEVEALGDTSICIGASSAQLDVQILNGANAPYSYSWSPASDFTNSTLKSPTAVPNSTTTYTVSATNAAGCTATDDVTVMVEALDVFLGNDTTICINDSVRLNAATSPLQGLQFVWSDGSNDSIYWAPGTGTYWVQVVDACGNSARDTITITESYTNVLTTTSFTPVTCNGGNDGAANVLVTQGTAPFSYEWSDSSTNTSITNLTADIYTIIVTDANNCRSITDIDVIEPPLIVPILTLIDSANCYASPTGSASVQGSGGVGGYSYEWGTQPIITTNIANNLLGSSTYTVTVTDTNQCTGINSIYIPSPPKLTLQLSSAGTICHLQNDATAIVEATGGTPNYTYSWDANALNQASDTARNLYAGTYAVQVIDQKGCIENGIVTVAEADALDFNFEIIEPRCFGEANGSVSVNISNGLPPFQYNWETGVNGNQINNINSGVYSVTATDQKGCIETDSINLTQPSLLVLETITTDLSCFESQDGQLYMTASGGTTPYEYSYDDENFSNANIIYGLEEGGYPLTVRDTMGCEAYDFKYLSQPAELIINAGDDLLIEQGDSVELSVLTSQPNAPLTFIWTEEFERNSLSCDTCHNPMASPLSNLFYHVMVVDSNDCTVTDGLWIKVNIYHEIYVPNAFTPNDDAVNDIFTVHGREGIQVLNFKVFDRWGELLFEQDDFEVNDLSAGWDGTFKNEKLNNAVFTWVATAQFLDGATKTFSGNVTLIR